MKAIRNKKNRASKIFNMVHSYFYEYGFCSNYSTWREAKSASHGYDADKILAKVEESLLKVKNGEAVFERDSVLFESVMYSWPILAALLRVASSNGNTLNILDFGGSLGSHYYQYRSFLSDLGLLQWNIIEQENYVRSGRQFFESENLRFYLTIDECLSNTNKPDVILLSGVLPYLEQPYAFLDTLMKYDFPYILIDRTPFLSGKRDRLTIQKIPPSIYAASYPAWFFDRNKLLSIFANKYETISEFEGSDGTVYLKNPRADAEYRGCIFKLKEP